MEIPRSDDHSTFYLTSAVLCSVLAELRSASVLCTLSRRAFPSYPVRRISRPAPVSADGGGVQEVHCSGDKRRDQTQRLGFLRSHRSKPALHHLLGPPEIIKQAHASTRLAGVTEENNVAWIRFNRSRSTCVSCLQRVTLQVWSFCRIDSFCYLF